MPSRNRPKIKNRTPVGSAERISKAASSYSPNLLLAVIALIALVAIAYGNSLGNGFVWDDHQQLVLNPYIKPDAPIAPIFTGDVRFAHETRSIENKVYRPLPLLTERIAAGSIGETATVFHSINLLFAIGATLAAFATFWLLTQRLALAFAAAAVFAVHPIHTEAVDWIASLPDLECTFFLLLSFAFFVVDHPATPSPAKRPAWLNRCLSLSAYAAALLCKETALVFPVLIAAYAAIAESPAASRIRRAIQQSLPYWGVLAACLALRAMVLGTFSGGSRNWALSPIQYALTALHLFLLYWAKLALPINLNAYYVLHPIHSIVDPRALAAIAVSAAIVAAIVYLVRRPATSERPIPARLAAFAALWVCLSLLPALNLAALGRNAFAERYLYLPSAGFCLLLVLGASRLLSFLPARSQRAAKAATLLLALAAFTAETIARNPDWKDDPTLFAKTLEQSPDSQFVRIMVADAQSSDPSQTATAEQNYLQAVNLAMQQIPPDRIDALAGYEGLAGLYADHARDDQALAILAKATALAPGEPNLTAQRAMILAREGRGTEAEPLLHQSLAVQPDNENVLATLGIIERDEHHNLGKAAQLFSKAIAVHPQQDGFAASQHNNLGAVYGDQGNMPAAINEFRQSVAIDPKDPEFHLNLATALAATGQDDDARSEAETTLRIDPEDPNARELLQRLPADGRPPQ